jgi:hypothetical protein
MPNQWRTIAPLVGRTAAQCLEHYEKLLYVVVLGCGSGFQLSDKRDVCCDLFSVIELRVKRRLKLVTIRVVCVLEKSIPCPK